MRYLKHTVLLAIVIFTAAQLPTVINPIVEQYLCIDVDNLDNYANRAVPAHYMGGNVAAQDNTPADNAITDIGATLGRVLFYDKNLSVNNTTSCASCHQQSNGFVDAAVLSVGIDGVSVTGAHSMRLGNARYFAEESMFWDKRAATLEIQTSQPIQDPVEMGFDASNGGLPALFTKMNELPYYPELFTLAFGDATINEDRVQKALAQFIRSMASYDSRWDAGVAMVPGPPGTGIGQPLPNLTAAENRGLQLFFQAPNNGGAGCQGCHAAPTFSLPAGRRSNGLDAGETTIFKSPSLKNMALTGPYMHDGRFATLEQVIDHYDTGVQNGPALDNRLRGPGGQPLRLNLTAQEKSDLLAFLLTLNDPVITTDARWSDPFCGVQVQLKAYLQGAHNNMTGVMNTDLASNGLIPTTEPYSALGFTVENAGVTIASSLQTNPSIVDWVLIELRDKANANSTLSTQAALLTSTGEVIDPYGAKAIYFTDAIPDEYYVAIRHRNHLGVMTSTSMTLTGN